MVNQRWQKFGASTSSDRNLCKVPVAEVIEITIVARLLMERTRLRLSVCVARNTVITVKHILIECADLSEITKKYLEEKSLYSLFRNVIPEIIFDFL